ncbi:ABC transporter permease [Rossellomorea vietnamensis]|uniref:ABC transporter permease n=1 Tax=Rossellomorea vietnamensis TaxID=218284 RepID=A0A5D4MK77_9BACI|nr:ABC transporter permease [Rossellomorea vietnamensis]TYS01684.1 ABC transporter permease [Rossellomorea vietnamensis]
MKGQLMTKTGLLFRFILRQDRVRVPVWIVSLSILSLLTAQSFEGLYPTKESRDAIAQTMMNPAMTAMLGKGYGIDNYTYGAMFAHEMLLFTAVLAAIMSILLTARHTRAEEEDGRIEMIRSLPAGRLANLTAAGLTLVLSNLLLALGTGLGLYAMQIESMDLNGSLLYGAALGATGLFFSGVTAVFAQLSETSRGAIGYSFTVLGVAYLVRAIGDVSSESLSWFSPLGWVLGSEVYVNNYWWPVIMTASAAAALILFSFYLNSIRDLGSGFLPSRPGKRFASSLLLSPFGLAARLQRTGLISWAAGMLLIGASYGSIFGDLESFFSEIDMMQKLLPEAEGFSLTEQFLAKIMSIVAMISTVPALMVVLKLKGEEKAHRTEHLLARAVSRNRLLGSYLALSFIVSFVMQGTASIGLGATANAMMENSIDFFTFIKAGMVYLPAMWILIALAVLLVGFLPRFTGLAWLYLGYSFFVVYLGGMFQFDDWVGNISPFAHIPELPIEEMNFLKVILLSVIAIIIAVAGLAGYRRRDIQG